MRFVVMAWDGDDPEAKERRAAVRPVHLENIQPFVDDGHVLVGGAMLDDEGDMIGSTLVVEFDSRSDLDAAYDRLPDDTRGELKQAIAQARKQFGHGAMPVDVWIDGDGLLRRMTMSLESGGNSAVDFGMEVTVEIPEYGIAMHLPIPKDGDVTDVSDLLPAIP